MKKPAITLLGLGAVLLAGSPVQAAPTLDQPPNQATGFFSDEVCGVCSAGSQAAAENFVVSTGGLGFDLEQIVVWGGFFSGNVPPGTDDVDVLIHADAAGLPAAAALCSETGIVPTSRVDTGVDMFGVDEYMVTIDLSTQCTLADGTYWIELFYDTGPGDDWFWESATLDGANGIVGSAVSSTVPGSVWTGTAPELAVQLNGTTLPVELMRFSVE